jgi:hypothetical protein
MPNRDEILSISPRKTERRRNTRKMAIHSMAYSSLIFFFRINRNIRNSSKAEKTILSIWMGTIGYGFISSSEYKIHQDGEEHLYQIIVAVQKADGGNPPFSFGHFCRDFLDAKATPMEEVGFDRLRIVEGVILGEQPDGVAFVSPES